MKHRPRKNPFCIGPEITFRGSPRTQTTKQGAAYTHTPRQSRVPRAALAMGSVLKGRKGRSCWEGCRQRASSPAADDSLPLLTEPKARATSPLPAAGKRESLGSSAPASPQRRRPCQGRRRPFLR